MTHSISSDTNVQLLRAYYLVRNDQIRCGLSNTDFVKMVERLRAEAIASHTSIRAYVSWMLGSLAAQPVDRFEAFYNCDLVKITLPVTKPRLKLIDVLGEMQAETLPVLIVLVPKPNKVIELVM